MAPVSGKKRTSARAKPARASRPQPTLPTPSDDLNALFPSSKKDKRTIKHSAFVSRIEKSSSKVQKRRRPNNKLVANLESLADALPGLEEAVGDGEVVLSHAKIQKKSLKSRPGAMKKKERLEMMEKDRFNRNLAQMAMTSGTAGSSSTADRWAALKNHVQTNMEVKLEFVNK